MLSRMASQWRTFQRILRETEHLVFTEAPKLIRHLQNPNAVQRTIQNGLQTGLRLGIEALVATAMPPPPPVYVVRSAREEITTPRFLESTFDRTTGTVGFFGGLFMYFGMCCCLCSSSKHHPNAIRDTYNRHTLCGLICPVP